MVSEMVMFHLYVKGATLLVPMSLLSRKKSTLPIERLSRASASMLTHSSSSIRYCLSSQGLMRSTVGALLSIVTCAVDVCGWPPLSTAVNWIVYNPLSVVFHTASVPLSTGPPPPPMLCHCLGSSPAPTATCHSFRSPILAFP